jgi:hypothetical protein
VIHAAVPASRVRSHVAGAIVRFAKCALPVIGISARIKRSLPLMQEKMIGLVWAYNQVVGRTIFRITINVMNYSFKWKRLPKMLFCHYNVSGFSITCPQILTWLVEHPSRGSCVADMTMNS